MPLALPHAQTVGLAHASTAPNQAGKKEEGEMSVLYEQVLHRFKTLPRIPLTEPEARINFGSLSDGKHK